MQASAIPVTTPGVGRAVVVGARVVEEGRDEVLELVDDVVLQAARLSANAIAPIV
jgi:hypothetical protein